MCPETGRAVLSQFILVPFALPDESGPGVFLVVSYVFLVAGSMCD